MHSGEETMSKRVFGSIGWFLFLWLYVYVLMICVARAQQPQTQTAPIYSTNSKYANGVAPGYWPTQQEVSGQPARTGLQLNIGQGTANCAGAVTHYAGGTLTLTASATNRIYLDPGSSCAVSQKTSGFTSTDIPIAVVVTGSSSITSIDDVRTMFHVLASPGDGVTSLQGLTGDVILESADSSVTITTPDSSHINFQAAGGGGSIVPPNPSNTNYFVLTDSRGLSSGTSAITIPPATAANCNGTTCIITALNNFKTGDWVGFCCSGFDPSSLVGNPYYAQVLSTGLSSTQFEIASTVTGTGTGGALVNATYNWPLIMANKPYFNGHGTVSAFNPTSGETLPDFVTFYNATIHPLSTGQTGNPGYLFLLAGYNDLVINGGCAKSALPSMEAGYQQLWALAHADGMQVVMLTNPANSHASDGGACNDNSFYYAFQSLNLWTKAQGKGGYIEATTGTASSGSNSLVVADGTSSALFQEVIGTGIPNHTYITACSPSCAHSGSTTLTLSANTTAPLSSVAVYFRNQYWDYLVDAASQINSLNQMTQPANPPHFSDQGNQVIAQDANATLLNYLQLKTQAGHGDGAPNLQQTNWWIPAVQPGGAGEQQLMQFNSTSPGSGDHVAWWGVQSITDGNCAAFGYHNSYTIGDPAIWIDFAGGPCDGGDLYPFLSFHNTSPRNYGHLVEPENECFGWANAFGQGAPDTSFCRGAGGIIYFGQGGGPTDDRGSIRADHTTNSKIYNTSNLPSCGSSNNGAKYVVSDATLPTFLDTYTGGGGVESPVLCNGTNWVTY
jgi:hypothetical protein